MRDVFGGVDEAVHATVHDYRDSKTGLRGAPALGPKVAMQPGTLSNKANPAMPDHQLTLPQAAAVQHAAGDYRILQAFAADLGHVVFPLDDDVPACDVAVLDQYAAFHADIGRKSEAIRAALADGAITHAEAARIAVLFRQAIASGLRLVARLESLAG